MTTYVPVDMQGTLQAKLGKYTHISLWKQPLQDSSGCFQSEICAAPDSSMTQVATGPTHNATVLHAGVEVGGFPCAGLFGRKRLHGGEDEGKTVRNILIWCTGQSRCVSCRRLTEEKNTCVQQDVGSFGTVFLETSLFLLYRPHLQP